MTTRARQRSPGDDPATEATPGILRRLPTSRLGVPEPVRPPLAAVESVRTEPIVRAVFSHAKMVHVLEGAATIETESGVIEFPPGAAMALGAGRWCTVRPQPWVRMWTIFLDEEFLRTNMRWVLSDFSRARPGTHPDSWDGSALILHPGVDILRNAEAFWRQISVIDDALAPEIATARLIGRFAGAVEALLPALLSHDTDPQPRAPFPITGRLATTTINRSVQRAADMMRARLAEEWTMDRLAREVALSRAHLSRAFTQQLGIAPMRYLTEVRLTEFTRLLEETDLSIGVAAGQVGWADPRVASAWFQRRFGITPSDYRRNPHPSCTGQGRCDACQGSCTLVAPSNGTRQLLRSSRRNAQIRELR